MSRHSHGGWFGTTKRAEGWTSLGTQRWTRRSIKQSLDGETEKWVTFASAPPQDDWSPEATSLNTPPSFRKPLGRSATALRPAGTSGARRETVAERLTASARKESEISARTTFENTPRSSRSLAPLFAPGSQAWADGSQASTLTRASYLNADEEGDQNDSPSHESRPMYRKVSRHEVGTRDTLQIIQKWGVSFSGKRDSSAEEFLTSVREFQRGSPLSDEEI